ncbi:transmembrane protein 141 isoform X1 [Anas platyrhynchos]|uniref:transmembrane protein 141 isoform X1 n=1 Tax=Anas platyrhynchos TaxID=8839 RepID=UPI000F7CBA20|nr:transmembrane protein 141 isoform X1 [Anas platyrhynchos]|eukprot:XP_027326681.1 transmembrane protein 141 isoform X1 [Anas platyrhynchos]
MGNLGLQRVDESVAARHPVRPGRAPPGGGGPSTRPPAAGGLGWYPARGPWALAGSGAAFAVQKLVNKKLPYALQYNLLLSVAAGSLASYMVTKAETQKCSDFWIYLETGKSPQEHTMADGLSQPTESLSPEDAERVAPPVRRNKYGDIVE